MPGIYVGGFLSMWIASCGSPWVLSKIESGRRRRLGTGMYALKQLSRHRYVEHHSGVSPYTAAILMSVAQRLPFDMDSIITVVHIVAAKRPPIHTPPPESPPVTA